MFNIIQYYLMRIQWMEKNEKKEIGFFFFNANKSFAFFTT